MIKKAIALFCLFSLCFLLLACNILSHDKEKDSGIPGTGLSGASSFTPAQVVDIVERLNSKRKAVFNKTLNMPAYSFYRFDYTNPAGGQRLSTIVSYDQAASQTTFGIEDTAKVLIFEEMQRKIGYSFDYFPFIATVPAHRIEAVNLAILSQFSDLDFTAKSSLPLASGPMLLKALPAAILDLPVPPKADFVAQPVNQPALLIELTPKFPTIDLGLAMKLAFTDEMQFIVKETLTRELSALPYFKSNVTPLSVKAKAGLRESTVTTGRLVEEQHLGKICDWSSDSLVYAHRTSLNSASGSFSALPLTDSQISSLLNVKTRAVDDGSEFQVSYTGGADFVSSWNGSLYMMEMYKQQYTWHEGGSYGESTTHNNLLAPRVASYPLTALLATATITELQCEVVAENAVIASFPVKAGSTLTQTLKLSSGKSVTVNFYAAPPPLSSAILTSLANDAIASHVRSIIEPIELTQWNPVTEVQEAFKKAGINYAFSNSLGRGLDSWITVYGTHNPPIILSGLDEFVKNRALIARISINDAGALPEVLIAGIATGSFNTAQNFTISGAATGATLEYSLDGGKTWKVYPGSAVSFSEAGTYIVFARRLNSLGTPGALSGGFTVVIDKTAPIAPTVNGIVAGTFGKAQSFTVAGAESGGSLQYSLDNGVTWKAYSTNITLSNEGTYVVITRQTDTAGNVGPTSAGITVVIKITIPGPPTVGNLIAGSYSSDQSFTVTGAESGGTLQYSLDNGTAWTTYTAAVTLSNDGSYTVTARQINADGNIGQPSAAIAVVIDKTGPAMAVGYPVAGDIGISSFSVKIKTADSGKAWVVALNAGAAAPGAAQIKAGTDAAGTAALNTSSSITAGTELILSFTGIQSEKSHDVYVVVEDALGNLGSIGKAAGITTLANMVLAGSMPTTWTARSNFALVSYGSKLWTMFGWTAGANMVNDYWNSTDGTTWTQPAQAASTPAGRGAMSYAVFNNQIWVAGGFKTGGGYLNDIYTYDGSTNAWTTVLADAAPPAFGQFTRRNRSGMVAFNPGSGEALWLYGGHDGNYLNDQYKAAFAGNYWATLAAASWPARQQMAMTVYNNKIWLLGGDNGTALNDCYWSANGTTWTAASTPGNIARTGAALAVHNGKLYAFGGTNAAGTALKDLWYTTDGTTWTEVKNLGITARSGMSMISFNGKLMIIGGLDSSSTYQKDIWFYTEP